MNHLLIICATILALSITMYAIAQNKMNRTDLLTAKLNSKTVSSVKVVQIEFGGGQKGAYHKHPCPVIGYIVEGTCLLQVEGEPIQILKAGDAFFEPAEKPITHFDNYSETEPLKFIAYYLLDGEKELIELLPTTHK